MRPVAARQLCRWVRGHRVRRVTESLVVLLAYLALTLEETRWPEDYVLDFGAPHPHTPFVSGQNSSSNSSSTLHGHVAGNVVSGNRVSRLAWRRAAGYC